ncbi:MAG: aldehyde dehydrogenase family protein [Chloroflexi bacterium]|nr:MAG: aldehyde dehydrogenase family protein [Chloroflexota bacterium]
MFDKYDHFINGGWAKPDSGEYFDTVDPATEEPIAKIARGNAADIDRAVQAARTALNGRWGQMKPKERARMLYNMARAIEVHADELAELETRDSGKPLQLAHKEVMSTARYFEYYAGAADKLHGEQIPLGPDYVDFTIREPMGVTAHIVPWNMPLNMVGRSVAPALAAGNTAVVKPAEQTPLTALKLAELFVEIGFPPGVYNVVTGFGEEAGAALASHPDIDSLTFTGSVETGRLVMKMAADHIKPVVLELGGKSPHIVFADADLDTAVAEAAKGIYANCGQICSAGSRLVIDARIKDQFLEKFVAHSQKLRIGPGLEKPDMGPLVSAEQYERVMNYLRLGQEEGAQVVTGGGRPSHLERGYFVAPTVFDNARPEMRIAQEEIFGPVLTVLTFHDEEEAIEIANNVKYGLVAGIFTNDISRALRLATRIKAGQIYINEYFAGGEETPFGGYKQSGFGREKGLEALLNYTQVKNVAIRIR